MIRRCLYWGLKEFITQLKRSEIVQVPESSGIWVKLPPRLIEITSYKYLIYTFAVSYKQRRDNTS